MADFDNPWKDVLDGLFEECLSLFFPDLHAALDWSRGFESLEQELRTISREAEIGLRIADKLVKAWRRDGTETWLLVHLEVQNQRDPSFAERMYTSNYRIRDRYGVHPVSLAILGDVQSGWRPNEYLHEQFGCRLQFQFPIVKLSDFEARQRSLEVSENPFGQVVLAHLAMQATRQEPLLRSVEKLRLAKQLYNPKWSKVQIENLFRFIDWLMELPQELERTFNRQLQEFERGIRMPFLTSIEREAIEKGREEGLRKGHQEGRQEGHQEGHEKGQKEGREKGLEEGRELTLRQAIAKAWKARFGEVPPVLSARLETLKDLARLDELFDASLTATLAEVEQRLA